VPIIQLGISYTVLYLSLSVLSLNCSVGMEICVYSLSVVIILTTFNIQLYEFHNVLTMKSGKNRHTDLSFQHLDMLVFLRSSGNTIKNWTHPQLIFQGG
jgi:hypothetical protein